MISVLFRSYRPKYSGYGYGTLEFEKLFKKRGYDFSLEYALEAQKGKRKKADVVIHSGFPHFFRIEPESINIGRVMLESDSCPRLWADVMNRLDEVWVASSFNVETFTKGGVEPAKLKVIPDIVSDAITSRSATKRAGGKFRFLSVFLDLSLRKGWDVMLKEFTGEFAGNKSVEWFVQCSAPAAKEIRKHLAALRKSGTDVSNIKVSGKRPSPKDLAALYASADCYVLPTRGEGFGRPYLEAASAGLPVIATGWSGQLDFLNRKNSRLVDYKLVKVPAPDALDCYFLAGQRWAEPSGSDLRAALKEALGRPKFEPVDLAPFAPERVMSLMEERLAKVVKSARETKPPRPEIIVYGKEWEESFLMPDEFVSKVRSYGKRVAVAGTGRNAGWLAEFLISKGVEIPHFIDREPGRFMGKKVLGVKSVKTGVDADLVLISAFPASFAEWRVLLDGSVENFPVIFYRQADQG